MPEYITNNPNEWPYEMCDYLKTHHFDLTEAAEYGICYDMTDKRMIIPSFDHGGNLIMYQSRRLFNDGTPKYLTVKEKDTFTRHMIRPSEFKGDHNTCIITEDMLSALRVSEAGYCAIPLYGTYMSPELTDYINKRFTRGVVWLDNDSDEVVIASNNIRKLLNMLLKRGCKSIPHLREPKFFTPTVTNVVLKEILKND